MKMSTEFYTVWARTWAQNYKEFEELNEQLHYGNVRGNVCEAQREFEKHLSEIMNHQPHQQEF